MADDDALFQKNALRVRVKVAGEMRAPPRSEGG